MKYVCMYVCMYANSKFTQAFIFDLGMQILNYLTVS